MNVSIFVKTGPTPLPSSNSIGEMSQRARGKQPARMQSIGSPEQSHHGFDHSSSDEDIEFFNAEHTYVARRKGRQTMRDIDDTDLSDTLRDSPNSTEFPLSNERIPANVTIPEDDPLAVLILEGLKARHRKLVEEGSPDIDDGPYDEFFVRLSCERPDSKFPSNKNRLF